MILSILLGIFVGTVCGVLVNIICLRGCRWV